MKKFLAVIIILLVSIFCLHAIYTDEEFNEVYNALEESTIIIDELNDTIKDLKNQVEILKTTNLTLEKELNNSNLMLDIVDAALIKTENQLEKSNNLIKKLDNHKMLIGVSGNINGVSNNKINFGLGINLGYKLYLGYLTGNFTTYYDKSFSFGIGYNIII